MSNKKALLKTSRSGFQFNFSVTKLVKGEDLKFILIKLDINFRNIVRSNFYNVGLLAHIYE